MHCHAKYSFANFLKQIKGKVIVRISSILGMYWHRRRRNCYSSFGRSKLGIGGKYSPFLHYFRTSDLLSQKC